MRPGSDSDYESRPERVFDRGLQHERTTLAWDRTGLSMLVVGALLIRGGGPPYDDAAHAAGYLALGVGAALIGFGGRRYERRESDLRASVSPVRPRLVVLTAFTTFAVSVAALIVIMGYR